MATPPPPSPEQPDHATGDHLTGDDAFDAYTAAMTEAESGLLGHLVFYSVFDGEVLRDDVERWFAELGLNSYFLPPDLRADDAFEKVTGSDGVRRTYPLDDPTSTAASRSGTRRRRWQQGALSQTAVLMVRPVRHTPEQLVRHVVREVRDAKSVSLAYDTRLATCVFDRDTDQAAVPGAGVLHVQPDHQAIGRLPEAEQQVVHEMLAEVEASFQSRCTYLTGDKLRSMLRRYVESLNAVRVRPTGGVYYIPRQHAETLGALRTLVSRFGRGSHLVRVPLLDQVEMREMVVSAFTTKAASDLSQLSKDIAAVQRNGRPEEVAKLHQRFTVLKEATAEHSEVLANSLDDTEAALALVQIQLTSLLTAGPDTGDDE